MAANEFDINTTILIQPVKLHYKVSTRTKYRMKWAFVLLLFIFYTHIIIWALARSHPHGHEEAFYGVGLDRGVTRNTFDKSSEASSRIKRSSRRIFEGQHTENEDGPLIGEEYVKGDYGISDPPPVTSWPDKKPVQYRIFSRPPSPSPHP